MDEGKHAGVHGSARTNCLKKRLRGNTADVRSDRLSRSPDRARDNLTRADGDAMRNGMQVHVTRVIVRVIDTGVKNRQIS